MATDTTPSTIVPELLTDKQNKYKRWSICMRNYLLAHDLWDVIQSSDGPRKVEIKEWIRKNALALHAIQVSCGEEIFEEIEKIQSAKRAWESLAKKYRPPLQGPTKDDSNAVEEETEDDSNAVEEETEDDYESIVVENESGINILDRTDVITLLSAIYKGDLHAVKCLFNKHRHARSARLLENGYTALHVAITAGQLKIAEELIVWIMYEEDLAIQDNSGNTALSIAAYNGMTKIAKCLVRKNSTLLSIPDYKGKIPLVLACGAGHKRMTRYIYSVTPLDLLDPAKNGSNHGSFLLEECMTNEMFDIALDLLQRFPSLAVHQSFSTAIPISTLAMAPHAFFSGSQLLFWKRWIYHCIRVKVPSASSCVHVDIDQQETAELKTIKIQGLLLGLLRGMSSMLCWLLGIKKIYDIKLSHAYALETLRLMCKQISTLDDQSLLGSGAVEATFLAVKHGIVEILVEITKANPDMIWSTDPDDSRDILMSAIACRQEKIAGFVYGLDAWKDATIITIDDDGNNLLHMAGKLAPEFQLARISGAALQMQRELQWFKEVEGIVPQCYKGYQNQDHETPAQVFTREHKSLLKEAEEWLKKTAESSTVVGALIITIMFAAAFTVPGSNNQVTGFPIFLHKKSFMIFIASDAISLFAASTSVLMFLGILTSRYAEKDFLKSLPTKLIIGLSTLFISIAAMMVSFSAALLIMLQGRMWLVIPIILLASVPVTLFVLLQFPLLVEIFVLTYGSGIFKKKRSLMRKMRTRLLGKGNSWI